MQVIPKRADEQIAVDRAHHRAEQNILQLLALAFALKRAGNCRRFITKEGHRHQEQGAHPKLHGGVLHLKGGVHARHKGDDDRVEEHCQHQTEHHQNFFCPTAHPADDGGDDNQEPEDGA